MRRTEAVDRSLQLRDELLNGELFFSLAEAQVLIEAWRRHYNAARPHSSLNYRPPAPETIVTSGGPLAPWTIAPAVGGARARPTPAWRQQDKCTNIELGSPLGGRPI
jgi:hypothetical protein